METHINCEDRQAYFLKERFGLRPKSLVRTSPNTLRQFLWISGEEECNKSDISAFLVQVWFN